MLDQAWLIPTIPALSFFAILFFGKRLPRKGSEIGILAVGSSFVLACITGVQWINRVDDATGNKEGLVGAFGKGLIASSGGAEAVVQPVIHHVEWWQNGPVKFGVGTQIDGLAVMMMFVVTLISLLVHVYSTAYMHDDRRYTHYYAFLSLFTASMLTLVVADNTLQLLVGWELVGLCSFILIGHWWEEGVNSRAAIKAFLTTRTGDIGLMLGVIITFFAAGTFSIVGINTYALSHGAQHDLLLAGAICLFIGIIGKSGQFPLHTWLPDAMAGPTPVSALIHAATMVVAGVYLGARLYPVFYNGFSIGHGGVNFMAVIGGTTIIIGALLAFVQDDIKKVLAYSTISQLGYMVMALGVGAWTAAVFHLFTHAFFKALLFLGAGSVSHSGSHHSFDMKKDMGGLRKFMPITYWTFIIGSLALAGIFPFAGFWSKDEILVTAGKSGFDGFLVVGLVGAFLTAAYMMRCVYLTFFGEYRGHGHPHESERAITIPLVILGIFSVLAGLLNAAPLGLEKFRDWVEPRVAFPQLVHPDFDYGAAALSVAIAVIAIGIAAYFFFRREELTRFKDLTKRNRLANAGYTFLVNKYYLDDLYENVIVDGTRGAVARASYWINQNVIDGVVNAVGRGTARLGRATYDVLDQRLVDGAVNGIAIETGMAGSEVRKVQSGRVQRYALLLFAGVTLLALAIFIINIA
jgi:NADH-quinone oxidoreductase subunit L